MRFVVLGATGRAGRQVVERALARGHSVTAVVRDASIKEAEGLRIVVADPCSTEDLVTILAGQDAVISCLGQRPGGSPWFVRDAAKAMLEAMQKAKVRRYVIVSGALLYPSLNPLVVLLKRVMANKLMDARATENLICAADLDWTIVRPPHLRDGNASKGYRIEAGPRPRLTWGLQFRDLADSLLDLAEGDCFNRQIVGVASR
jgi:putative NADH-flavin reductase